jgi:hypothetical protein
LISYFSQRTTRRTHGYNKLVLAQHLDDLVESFLMSALHNGQVRAFPQSIFLLMFLYQLESFLWQIAKAAF